jgi:hypothetical protein
MSTKRKRPKLTVVEKLLKQVRENPSRTCNDPRQIDLFEHQKRAAFAKLDEAIARIIEQT